MGKGNLSPENSRYFIILGNGGLVAKDQNVACATDDEDDLLREEMVDDPNRSDDEDKDISSSVEACDSRLVQKKLSVDDCEIDIQPTAIDTGLQLATAINAARGRLGQLVGMGVLFDIPRGLKEIDAFNPELRTLSRDDPKRISVGRLEKGTLPTLDDLADQVRSRYLSRFNQFNAINGVQFHLNQVAVLTGQRARREVMRMVIGEEGYPDISGVDRSELTPIYSLDEGKILVKCAGVYAATNWLFSRDSGGADVYGVWEVDRKRVKGSNRGNGAAFARKYLGVGKVVDRVISTNDITYVGDNGEVKVNGESLWTAIK